MADLVSLQAELCNILGEKKIRVKELIKKAAAANIHVDILVCAEMLVDVAWEYLENIGFPKGSSDLFNVLPDLEKYRCSDHLQVTIENIAAS